MLGGNRRVQSLLSHPRASTEDPEGTRRAKASEQAKGKTCICGSQASYRRGSNSFGDTSFHRCHVGRGAQQIMTRATCQCEAKGETLADVTPVVRFFIEGAPIRPTHPPGANPISHWLADAVGAHPHADGAPLIPESRQSDEYSYLKTDEEVLADSHRIRRLRLNGHLKCLQAIQLSRPSQLDKITSTLQRWGRWDSEHAAQILLELNSDDLPTRIGALKDHLNASNEKYPFPFYDLFPKKVSNRNRLSTQEHLEAMNQAEQKYEEAVAWLDCLNGLPRGTNAENLQRHIDQLERLKYIFQTSPRAATLPEDLQRHYDLLKKPEISTEADDNIHAARMLRIQGSKAALELLNDAHNLSEEEIQHRLTSWKTKGLYRHPTERNRENFCKNLLQALYWRDEELGEPSGILLDNEEDDEENPDLYEKSFGFIHTLNQLKKNSSSEDVHIDHTHSQLSFIELYLNEDLFERESLEEKRQELNKRIDRLKDSYLYRAAGDLDIKGFQRLTLFKEAAPKFFQREWNDEATLASKFEDMQQHLKAYVEAYQQSIRESLNTSEFETQLEELLTKTREDHPFPTDLEELLSNILQEVFTAVLESHGNPNRAMVESANIKLVDSFDAITTMINNEIPNTAVRLNALQAAIIVNRCKTGLDIVEKAHDEAWKNHRAKRRLDKEYAIRHDHENDSSEANEIWETLFFPHFPPPQQEASNPTRRDQSTHSARTQETAESSHPATPQRQQLPPTARGEAQVPALLRPHQHQNGEHSGSIGVPISTALVQPPSSSQKPSAKKSSLPNSRPSHQRTINQHVMPQAVETTTRAESSKIWLWMLGTVTVGGMGVAAAYFLLQTQNPLIPTVGSSLATNSSLSPDAVLTGNQAMTSPLPPAMANNSYGMSGNGALTGPNGIVGNGGSSGIMGSPP